MALNVLVFFASKSCLPISCAVAAARALAWALHHASEPDAPTLEDLLSWGTIEEHPGLKQLSPAARVKLATSLMQDVADLLQQAW